MCVCREQVACTGENVKGGRLLLVAHLLVVFAPQVQQLSLCSIQCYGDGNSMWS